MRSLGSGGDLQPVAVVKLYVYVGTVRDLYDPLQSQRGAAGLSGAQRGSAGLSTERNGQSQSQQSAYSQEMRRTDERAGGRVDCMAGMCGHEDERAASGKAADGRTWWAG